MPTSVAVVRARLLFLCLGVWAGCASRLVDAEGATGSGAGPVDAPADAAPSASAPAAARVDLGGAPRVDASFSRTDASTAVAADAGSGFKSGTDGSDANDCPAGVVADAGSCVDIKGASCTPFGEPIGTIACAHCRDGSGRPVAGCRARDQFGDGPYVCVDSCRTQCIGDNHTSVCVDS